MEEQTHVDPKVEKESADSTKNDWLSKTISYVSKNVWILSLVVAVVALISLFGPLFSSKTVTYVNDGFEAGKRVSITIIDMFAGRATAPITLWGSLVLIVIASAMLFLRKKANGFLSASMLCYFVAGCLLFASGSSFDFVTLSKLGVDDYVWYVKDFSSVASTKLQVGIILPAVLCFACGFLAFSSSIEKDTISVGEMAEIGILVALAVALNFGPKWQIGADGGSINFAMFPLFLIALRKGPAKGFLAGGIVYGLITCFTDGYGLYLYPFDYLVGFGSIAIVGFFRSFILGNGVKAYNIKALGFIVLGCTLATIMRFFGSFTSSIVNYGYSFVGSWGYNIAYTTITGAIACVLLLALHGPLVRINKSFPDRSLKAE